MMTLEDYQSFLRTKHISAQPVGMADVPAIHSNMFAFQRHCVEFGLHAGSWACFLDTGLGKTFVELEWSEHARQASNGRALILTPLAVARQHESEGRKRGYLVRVIRKQADAREGINICNYDRLELIDPSWFGTVVLDESSIIKNWNGKTTNALIGAFSRHRWKMAASATPAPNDHVELGTHSAFLGIMPREDMLVRWFINDTANTGTWRLKGHARQAFWDWMASWSRIASHPRDLGFDQYGYDLPPLELIRHHADASLLQAEAGSLFAGMDVSATGIHNVKRQTAESRARTTRTILDGISEPVVVWCDSDYEADAIKAILSPMLGSRFVEVRGSMTIEQKEVALARFADGSAQVLSTKSAITGYGLNWQHCALTVFVGRSFSYESWYQAIRRFWRFGQARPVKVHIVVAEGEESIGRVIDRKSDDHDAMKREMVYAMKRSIAQQSKVRIDYNPTHQGRLPAWLNA